MTTVVHAKQNIGEGGRAVFLLACIASAVGADKVARERRGERKRGREREGERERNEQKRDESERSKGLMNRAYKKGR